MKEEIRHILIEVARARQVITYAELTSMLQTAYVHYHSHLLARLLVEIGSEEVRAGHGFFKLAAERGYDVSEPEAFWQRAVQEVYEFWASSDRIIN